MQICYNVGNVKKLEAAGTAKRKSENVLKKREREKEMKPREGKIDAANIKLFVL